MPLGALVAAGGAGVDGGGAGHVVEAKRGGGCLRPGRAACDPSGPRGCIGRSWICSISQSPRPSSSPSIPRPTGMAGDLCELTEVGAVLVGGGELHDTFDSLVRTERPLSRGIQRFTGITQAMVDSAPPPARGARGARRAARRPRAWSPTRLASTGACCAHAFERAGLDWPKPPVLCTVQLARRYAPLAQKRGARAAGRLARHRGDRGPPRAAGCAHLRARALRAVPAPVRQRGHGRRGAGIAQDAPARAQDRAGRAHPARRSAPTCRRSRTTRASTSSATSAAGRCTSASRSPCARGRAPTSARRPAGPSVPRSSTTAPPTPSSARSCSRTA